MALQQQFNEAAEKVKNLTKKPTDEELLELYAFYKQATEGDNESNKPIILDLKGKKKWESWRSKKGITKDDAQKFYVDHVQGLIGKYS